MTKPVSPAKGGPAFVKSGNSALSRASRREFQPGDLNFLKKASVAGVPTQVLELLQFGEGERQPWAKPESPLQIDERIETLINRVDRLGYPTSPRITRETTEGKCPYMLVRLWIKLACGHAKLNVEQSRRLSKEREKIDERLKELKKSTEAIAKIAIWDPSEVDIGAFIRDPSLGNDNELKSRSETYIKAHDGLFRALSDLKDLTKTLEARREEIDRRQRPDHFAWRDGFIEHLGVGWDHLTGAPPGQSEHFIGFVGAAFETISGRGEIDWERAIRAVKNEVDARPEDERFDRIRRAAKNRVELPGARPQGRALVEYVSASVGPSVEERLARVTRALDDDALAKRLRAILKGGGPKR